MKRFYCYALIALLFAACDHPSPSEGELTAATQQSATEVATEIMHEEQPMTGEKTATETDDEDFVSLNTIRFGDWTDEDWLDNDYIRELRRYIDAYCRGEIENEALDQYKEALRGKFLVLVEEQALFGGLLIGIALVEDPRYAFRSWVYGIVVDNEVVAYEVRDLSPSEYKTGYTKEAILRLTTDHPEYKLW